jgi:hypothetical protein
MTDLEYGRPDGLNMLKLINRELRGVSQSLRVRTQIGMFRPIRMDHTNCLQVAIKTLQFNKYVLLMTECKQRGRTPVLSRGEDSAASVGRIQDSLEMCGTIFLDQFLTQLT